jgi:hypothetical protein
MLHLGSLHFVGSFELCLLESEHAFMNNIENRQISAGSGIPTRTKSKPTWEEFLSELFGMKWDIVMS